MKKKRILLLIALCLAMLLGQESLAQTAMESLKKEYPAVMEQYGKRLEAQKADYVIAIDVSNSMLRHKEIVEPALSSFIDALPDGDHLSIIKFGRKAEEFGLSGKVDQSTREGFKQTLSRIYVRDPEFVNSTNIYAMCETILAQMSRLGGNDLKYIFMFTDFIDLSGRQDNAYQILGDRVAGMAQTNTIRAFAMQLPGGNGEGRDIPKVRLVFPNLQIIDVDNSSQLNSWFEGQKAKISEVRLKDLIRGDFGKWYSENKMPLDLAIGLDKSLRIKYKVDDVVPAFVNGFMLQQCEPVSQSNNVEKIIIKHDTIFKGRDVSAKIGYLKFYKKNLIQKNTKATVAVTMRPTFTTGDKEGEPSFANEIRKLGLETDLLRSSELTAENDFVLGWSIWLTCALLLLLLVFLYYFVKMTVLPHRLNKVKVEVETVPSTNDQQYGHTFNKEVSYLFGKEGEILPSAKFVLRVRGRRGFPVFVPRSIVFEVIEKTDQVNFSFSKGDVNIPSLKSKAKIDETITIQQGSNIYTFTLRKE